MASGTTPRRGQRGSDAGTAGEASWIWRPGRATSRVLGASALRVISRQIASGRIPPPSQFRFRLGSVSTRIEPPSPSLPAAFYFSSFGWREATQRWTIAHSIFASAGSGRMHARTWLRPREGRVCPKWSPYEGGTPNFAVRTSRAALFAGCRSPCRSDRSRLARTG